MFVKSVQVIINCLTFRRVAHTRWRGSEVLITLNVASSLQWFSFVRSWLSDASLSWRGGWCCRADYTDLDTGNHMNEFSAPNTPMKTLLLFLSLCCQEFQCECFALCVWSCFLETSCFSTMQDCAFPGIWTVQSVKKKMLCYSRLWSVICTWHDIPLTPVFSIALP